MRAIRHRERREHQHQRIALPHECWRWRVETSCYGARLKRWSVSVTKQRVRLEMRAVFFNAEGCFAAHRLRAALDARHGEVLSASDIEELIALTRDTGPDLVVIGWVSVMAGALAVAREVREADRHVPLLLAVCACGSGTAMEAMRAGFNDIVTENCSDAEMADVLARL